MLFFSGSIFRVEGSEVRSQGRVGGHRVFTTSALRRVMGLGFRVWGLGVRVQG